MPPHLADALTWIDERLDAAGIAWVLTGSAMRALRGFDVLPADLDLEVAAEDVAAAGAILGLPPVARESDDAVSSLRSRGHVRGAEIDLSADLTVTGSGGTVAADFAGQRQSAGAVAVAGRQIPLSPLEESIARADARAPRHGRERLLAGAPPDLEIDEEWVRRRIAHPRDT